MMDVPSRYLHANGGEDEQTIYQEFEGHHLIISPSPCNTNFILNKDGLSEKRTKVSGTETNGVVVISAEERKRELADLDLKDKQLIWLNQRVKTLERQNTELQMNKAIESRRASAPKQDLEKFKETVLEDIYKKLEPVLSRNQIAALVEKKQVKWNDKEMEKARELLKRFSPDQYEYLRYAMNIPLPAESTINQQNGKSKSAITPLSKKRKTLGKKEECNIKEMISIENGDTTEPEPLVCPSSLEEKERYDVGVMTQSAIEDGTTEPEKMVGFYNLKDCEMMIFFE